MLGHVETFEYVGEIVGCDSRTIVDDPDLNRRSCRLNLHCQSGCRVPQTVFNQIADYLSPPVVVDHCHDVVSNPGSVCCRGFDGDLDAGFSGRRAERLDHLGGRRGNVHWVQV